MIDNNLILLISIGIIIFLIMNLNSKKSERKISNSSDYRLENFQQAPSPSITNAVKTAVMSGQPQPPASKPVATTSSDSLNNLYNSNLKGSPSPTGFSSNTTNTSFTADYGQGYNLGINMSDPALAKFTSQAPVQKAPLISDDLLPKKSENWFETPTVGMKIDDANLLADAIFKTGVDTIGSTRKNPSYDMRGNIPNPKFPVSPWNNSSYEPDNNLRGLCI